MLHRERVGYLKIVRDHLAESIDETINDQYLASRLVGLVMRTADGNCLPQLN